MRKNSPKGIAAPGPDTGFLGEAISSWMFAESEWLGGRTPHIDLKQGDTRIQVRSAGKAIRQFSLTEDPTIAIGARFNKPLDRSQVDALVLVWMNPKPIQSTVSVEPGPRGGVRVTTVSNIGHVEVYSTRDFDVFRRPLVSRGTRSGDIQASETNLWAPISELTIHKLDNLQEL